MRTFLTDTTNTSFEPQTSFSINKAWFHTLLTIGLVLLLLNWYIESQLTYISQIDYYGYSSLTITIVFGLIASKYFNKTYLAKNLLFFNALIYLSCAYCVNYLLAIEQGEMYPLTSSLQWLPLIYLLAFLVLEDKTAIYSTIATYIFLILFAVTLNVSAIGNSITDDIKALLVNTILSHGFYIFCLLGISKLKRHQRESQALAQHMEQVANSDCLLNIANRRRLQQLLDDCQTQTDTLSLLLVDIDNFKLINDNYGHQIGDQVLCHISQVLSQKLRSQDSIGRWGGEEFLIIAPGTSADNAKVLAEKLRSAIVEQPYETINHLTISIGIAEHITEQHIEQTLRFADQALYQAKDAGRNCVKCHNEANKLVSFTAKGKALSEYSATKVENG